MEVMDSETKFCSNCGQKILKKAVVCPHCNAVVNTFNSQYWYQKNKLIAALLAFFVGAFGMHWFYVGKKKYGIMMLACSIISLVIGVPLFIASEVISDLEVEEVIGTYIISSIILFIPVGISMYNGIKFLMMTDDKFEEIYIKPNYTEVK